MEHPIAKALWHIETQPADELTLEAIAAGAGVSRFYLSRAFTEVIGRPLIAYARGRRLSTGQVIAREVTRSVTNRVAGQIAADIGKSVGGKAGSSVGRAIVRGTLGGILRR